jgi:hypothetical protein
MATLMVMATDTPPTVMVTATRLIHTATAMARVTVMEVMGMLTTPCDGMFMPLMVSDIPTRHSPS